MLEDLALEAGNMKRYLEQLEAEIEKEPLDRFKIGGALSEIFLSYEKMKISLLLAWDSHVRSREIPDECILENHRRGR